MGGGKRCFLHHPVSSSTADQTLAFLLAQTQGAQANKTDGETDGGGRTKRKSQFLRRLWLPYVRSDIYIPIHTYSILIGGEICSIFWYVLFVGWRVGLPPQSDMPQPQKWKSELGLLLTLLGFLHSETATQTKEVSRPAGFGFPHLSAKYETSLNHNKKYFYPDIGKNKNRGTHWRISYFSRSGYFSEASFCWKRTWGKGENINCASPSVLRLGRRWLANLGLLARSRG